MTPQERDRTHFKTVCLNHLRWGSCSFGENGRCMHVCGDEKMTYKADIRIEVDKMLRISDKIPFSQIYTAIVDILSKCLVQVNFILKHMCSKNRITPKIYSAHKALKNTTLNIKDHLTGVIHLWSLCESLSHLPFEIKVKVFTKKPVREMTNSEWITQGDPLARDVVDKELSAMYKPRDPYISYHTFISEADATKEVAPIKEIDPIPPKMSFSLNAISFVDFTINSSVDDFVTELARRTAICYQGDLMNRRSFLKIVGYGTKIENPPQPLKEEVVCPENCSAKDKLKMEKKQSKNNTLYETALLEWKTDVENNDMLGNIILPPDFEPLTGLPSKMTCSGGEACNKGVHTHSDFVDLTGLFNEITENKVSTVQLEEKKASENTLSRLHREYKGFILGVYTPALITSHNAKTDTTVIPSKQEEYTFTKKRAIAKKSELEAAICTLSDEMIQYNRCKNITTDYGYTSFYTKAPVVIPAVEIHVIDIPVIVHVVNIPVVNIPVVDDFYDNTTRVVDTFDTFDDCISAETPNQKKKREKAENALLRLKNAK